jgi:hypothetical protein
MHRPAFRRILYRVGEKVEEDVTQQAHRPTLHRSARPGQENWALMIRGGEEVIGEAPAKIREIYLGGLKVHFPRVRFA